MATSSRSQSPPTKRLRLDPEVYDHENPEKPEESQDVEEDIPDDLEENNCSICLQPMVDRTLVPACSHEFCFDCLMIWSEQSRRCPLCTQNMGDHVIHHIRSRYDYQKYFLPPLRSKSPQMLPMARARGPVRRRRIPREIRERSRRERQEREEADRLDHAIEKRKWIYRHQLYAKHIASNAYTRYRPYPTPAQFSVNQDLISRTTSFLRRELRVWPDLDVEFLTTFIISLMKSIDIRSESAVKLLAEFLDMDEPYVEGRRHLNAEHFAHEVYSYVRSPYKDLFVYDTVAQVRFHCITPYFLRTILVQTPPIDDGNVTAVAHILQVVLVPPSDAESTADRYQGLGLGLYHGHHLVVIIQVRMSG
ncbi:hypothetical protein K435DRAFT_83093 [Dendrothele bispora CBS 962.96]|uniref:RING-type E3 ubiquitin transferase n=1 Tax=Dendrothele bispora (strain CBS 962.96) TaxID=1314807 RepID=A0A4S8M3Q4_DENBC|nr:hypothetical protein K435DRAFT_83093 [Dendrothele bispora CBS 962.96]